MFPYRESESEIEKLSRDRIAGTKCPYISNCEQVITEEQYLNKCIRDYDRCTIYGYKIVAQQPPRKWWRKMNKEY